MAHRHKVQGKNIGGAVNSGGNPKVIAEAKQRKSGGRVFKDGGKVVGKASGGRLDKRARGGGVGADKHPFSSAHLK